MTMETVIEKTGYVAEEKPSKPRFRGIDIGFLSMRLLNGLPRFAIMPLYRYDQESPAWVWTDRRGRCGWNEMGMDMSLLPGWVHSQMDRYRRALGIGDMEELVQRLVFIHADPTSKKILYQRIAQQQGSWVTEESPMTLYSALPSSKMPQQIRQRVDEALADGFVDLHVAWEATWRETAKLGEPEDPICIAKKDGKWHILGQWDLTKLESYIVAEFSE